MNEKLLERKVREQVKKLGGIAIKFTSPGHAGVFDRIVLVPHGLVWFVELKTTGRKLSPLQIVFQKQMTRVGMKTRVVDDEESLQKFLTEVTEAMISVKPKIISE